MSRSFLLLFILFLSACSSQDTKGVLPPPRMQSVLWDVMRSDELASYYAQKDSSFNNMQQHTDYYQEILSIHGISKNEFRASLKYYLSHPARFKVILDSLQSFAERAQRQSTYIPTPGRNQDSLNQRKPILKQLPAKKKEMMDSIRGKKSALKQK